MRARFLTSTALLVLAAAASPAALAADFSLGPLRGTQYGAPMTATHVWDGAYFGAFAGIANSNVRMSGALTDVVAHMMRDTLVEQELGVSSWLDPRAANGRDHAFGFFGGLNYQYDEAVLGFEADFTRFRLRATGSDTLARQTTTATHFLSARADGSVTAQLDNLVTLRARAGYTMGSFLPFVTAGMALTNFTVTRQATVSGEETVLATNVTSFPVNVSPTITKKRVGLGLTAGVGVDVAVDENFFLRGEWQYAYFPDLAGIKANVNILRAAAGVKF